MKKLPLEGVTVLLPAGGKGERLAQLAESQGVNKAALQAGGMSLTGRTISMYASSGVRKIVMLVYHQAQSVMDDLGDGSKFGVSISYSMDPEKPVGKGGAILTAIERGLVPAGHRFIVHNPDDQIVGIAGKFPALIYARHLAHTRRGALSTAVCVPWTEYAYSAFVMKKNGMATQAAMYPRVEKPTHIGVTVFEPEVIPVFRKLIDLTKKVDFESVVLPWLAKRNKLGISLIPTDSWIAVNDLKGYNKLVQKLGKGH